MEDGLTATLADLLSGHTLRTVAMGSGAIGVVSGVIGSFAVARGQSLLGDAVAHAALPGVVLAAILFGSREPWALLAGAAVAGLAAAAAITRITNATPVKFDSALGLVLSAAFGLGLMMLLAHSRSDSAQAGLNTFLFGQAAAIVTADLIAISVTGVVVLGVVIWRWNDLRAICFDADFAAVVGIRVPRANLTLVVLLVVTIALGLKVVGVVLMSAMLVAPALAARQWSDRFATVALLAGLFGALAGIAGSLVSALGKGLATGPLIVLALGAIALISILFAPANGLFPEQLARWRRGRRFATEKTLAALLALQMQHQGVDHHHQSAAIEATAPDLAGAASVLARLVGAGLASGSPTIGWRLTSQGVERARFVARERRFGSGWER